MSFRFRVFRVSVRYFKEKKFDYFVVYFLILEVVKMLFESQRLFLNSQ